MNTRFSKVGKTTQFNSTKTKILATLGVVAVLLLPLVSTSPAHADQFDTQINALKQKVAESQAAANQKAGEASTLKTKLAGIEAQINAAQQQLALTNTEISGTQNRINEANKDLDRQKSILKDNLKLIYKEGSVSPMEVIASSGNLSDFVAKQEYLSAIKKKIDLNLEKIDVLKKELDTKKGQLTALSTQQKTVYDQIASQRAEQQSILARTQGDEANYRQVAQEDSAKITELRKQQAAIIASFSSNVRYGGSGGYPWGGAPFPNSISDPWGMYQRQCVSYTAWKVATVHGGMPYWGGRGNASQWPGNARAAGIPVDGNPRPGDVAISMSGPYGHAMWVESVNGSTVHVSQYNANWDGAFSTSDINTGSAVYIHF
ncbi:CHAP domain-containing protein [Candidatus Saccharibacteria bacterium]|nr:CHAP domain-containing protein [Candidatus Saccharibacteria bacterium]